MIRLHIFVIILSVISGYFTKNILNEIFPKSKLTSLFNLLNSSSKGFLPVVFYAGIFWVILFLAYGELPY